MTASILTTEEQADPHPFEPAQILEQLMDLRGSVALSEFMTEDRIIPGAEPSHPESITALMAKTVEDVRSRLDFAIENAYRPRFRLPDAGRAWAILKRTKVLETFNSGDKKARNAALRSGTRLTWAPFGEFIETQLKRARFALRDLREELVGPLAGLGTKASHLERMDHALRTAVETETGKLFQRIGIHAERRFGAALQVALTELPDVAGAEAFALGFRSSGWLGDVFGEAQNMVRAVVEHEINQIENLVENAIALNDTD